jgi:hypothetical protein
MKKTLLLAIFSLLGIVASVTAQTSENKQRALDYIKSQEKELGIKSEHTFNLSFVKKSLAGETLRFQQMLHGVPVFGSEIVVNFSPQNEVAFLSDSYDKTIQDINVVPSINDSQAIIISNKELKFSGNISFQESKLYVINMANATKLVYRVVTNVSDRKGSWEVIVDAKTSQILSTKDIAYYYSDKDHKKDPNKKKRTKSIVEKTQAAAPLAFVSGTGTVFSSDPLSVAHVAYGGQYVDGGDATNASLNAARSTVTLPEIDLTGGVYKLKSSYVEIKELEIPDKGLFTQASNNFSFTRDQDGFEAVNVFYHTDKNLRYINETLGVDCRPLTNGGVLWFDPSGVDGDDNSYYTVGTLTFGEGCVDDAEDADVIWHELGHGLHNWMVGGNASSAQGLGEGSGDYWAQSNSWSLNQWASTDAAYHYMFNWDGHNECWGGRSTNYAPLYPGGLVGSIHTDGQIWSTSLMRIWKRIGRAKMDTAFLEGLALTNGSTNQQNAARAVRQAAVNMCYPCADVKAMTEEFTATGYVMPAVALKICCPEPQTVTAGAGNTYAVPSFSSLSNAINASCNAVITQSPAVGAVLAPGTYPVTMTATSGTAVNCNFNLIVQANLGVDEVVKRSIVIYPNPATNTLNVKGEFDNLEKVAIYNMLGQNVMNTLVTGPETAINISRLPKGVYTLNFESSKVPFKFIKQ